MRKEAMATADAVEAAAANIQASINGAAGDTSGIKKLRNALKDEFENLELLIKAHKSGTKAVENFNDALIVQEKLRKVNRSEEHKSELQSIMRNSYAVFCLKKKKKKHIKPNNKYHITTKNAT